MAEALQQMWKRALGVDITLRNEEWKVFLDTRRELNYQVARAGWLPFSAEPLELYELQTVDAGTNETGWSHPDYEKHYATALRTLDTTARLPHYGALDRILAEEMPVLPIAHYSRTRLIHPTVHGWATNHLEGLVWTRVSLDQVAEN
jgi:oligopeptide transport system substrate-binding protein